MRSRRRAAAIALGALLAVGGATGAEARVHPAANDIPARESIVTNRASGTFEVKLAPLATEGPGAEAGLMRLSLEKTFEGGLVATGRGEMIASNDGSAASGVYVAIERVTGTLDGRTGSFVLHHRGVMNRGAAELSIDIAPDSGTEQLAGLSGSMTIEIRDGKHFYALEYTLPAD